MKNNNFTRVPILEKEDVNEETREMFIKWEGATGKVPEWARVMANRPSILKEFFDLFKAVMGPGEVDEITKWRVAHQTSVLNKCEYCVDVTEMKLKAMGLDEEKINDVLTNEMASLSDAEKVAIVYAQETTLKANQVDDTVFQNLKNYYNDAQIVEITSVIGFFSYINRFNDALRVLPE
ncbi:MAG: peroxidase-related enzyme [Candidatus Moraniibacteriota bacterium]|nr:MAG: peroxidase-related enzyme [Candidatus Moranbacteria bacterium]